MKLGVVGSRLFVDYDFLKEKILETIPLGEIDTIVSGGARGVDTLAERFADEFNLKKNIKKPDWDGIGKYAALIRNTEIVENSDCVIAFPIKQSGGTWDTIRKARKAGKRVFVFEVDPPRIKEWRR